MELNRLTLASRTVTVLAELTYAVRTPPAFGSNEYEQSTGLPTAAPGADNVKSDVRPAAVLEKSSVFWARMTYACPMCSTHASKSKVRISEFKNNRFVCTRNTL